MDQLSIDWGIAEPRVERLEEIAQQNGHVETIDPEFGIFADQQKPTHHYEAKMLHKGVRIDWSYVPMILDRIEWFAIDYESQSNPEAMADIYETAFTMADPPLMAIAIFRDESLIGHVLCERCTLYMKPNVVVHQYMLDHGIPHETRHEIVRIIREWAKYTGPDGQREPATHIEWLVRQKRLVHMYQRMFKAKPHLVVMRLEVDA